MNTYALDIKTWGSTYIQADSPEKALEWLDAHCPLVIDVQDWAWFSRGDKFCLADAFTLHGPVEGQQPVRDSKRGDARSDATERAGREVLLGAVEPSGLST